MKNLFSKLCISTLVLGLLINCTTKLNTETLTTDILGESASDGSSNKGAITYSLGSNGGYILKDNKGYKSPEFMKKLPEKFELPEPGNQESIDEVPSTSDYYDGSMKLNVIAVECNINNSAPSCISQSSCGWCKSNGSCIKGNNLGPLQPCKPEDFVFSAPYPSWNPQTRISNDKIAGVNLTVVNK